MITKVRRILPSLLLASLLSASFYAASAQAAQDGAEASQNEAATPSAAPEAVGKQSAEPTANEIEVGLEADVQAEIEAEKAAAAAEAAAEARALELSRELEQRQAAIADLQSSEGIYDPSLIEAHDDIARLYIELEDYENAAKSLNEALQIVRINTGLYSEAQLPLIDDLIENHMQMKQWSEVDDLVHLDHHISRRLYELADAQYLDAAEDYGRWKLRVVRENLLGLNSRALMNTAEDLSDFYGYLIYNVEFAEEINADDLIGLLSGKSQADLTLARSIANTPYTYFEGTASRYVTQQRCRNSRNASGQLVRQCFNVQVENPRYRQSQIDAKRTALYRYTSEINRTLERLRSISSTSEELTRDQRAALESQIAQLQVEADSLRRVRGTGFRF